MAVIHRFSNFLIHCWNFCTLFTSVTVLHSWCFNQHFFLFVEVWIVWAVSRSLNWLPKNIIHILSGVRFFFLRRFVWKNPVISRPAILIFVVVSRPSPSRNASWSFSIPRCNGTVSDSVSKNLGENPGGGGYFGVKRIGMTVGNPRKLPQKIPSHKICAP